MTRIKICGLTRQADVRLAVALGADAVGFVLVPGSRRQVAPADLPGLAAAGQGALRVGVIRDLAPEQAVPLAACLDVLQLHGHEDAATVQRYRELLPRPFGLWKALEVERPSDLEQAAIWWPWVDAFVLDSGGGTGRPFDWELAHGWDPGVPWWLAGGLAPDNVQAAIRALAPPGVDVAGGVESAAGLKDSARLADFMNRVRST